MTPQTARKRWLALQQTERELSALYFQTADQEFFTFQSKAEVLRDLTARIRAVRYNIGTSELSSRECGIDLVNGKLLDRVPFTSRR